jgi:streptothricin acetyltransferase
MRPGVSHARIDRKAKSELYAMDCKIIEEPVSYLADYGLLPISFRVERMFEVTAIDSGLGGLTLTEREVDLPYVKDYDAIEGNGPACWAARWDLTKWALLSCLVNGRRAGGAVLAFDTEGVDMLEDRRDLAVLWDFRVDPDHRRQGVGRSLFLAAEEWARARGCRQLKAETQNINVPACRFYAEQGCVLKAINQLAYRDFPDETQLLWYKDLF